MPTDYSPLDALPAPQGSDVARVTAFTDMRAAIDGKLILTCTSATRPTGTARFAGRLIFESDTRAHGLWDGTTWRMWDTAPQAFTPTWGSSGTAPSIGNGSILGEYVRAGGVVHWRVTITPGSTTTFGSGEYTVSLPTACRGAEAGPVGSSYLYAAAYRVGVVAPTGPTTIKVYHDATPTTAWSATSPATFALGHKMTLAGSYIAP